MTPLFGIIGVSEIFYMGVIVMHDSIIRCSETLKCGVATPQIRVSHSNKRCRDTPDGHHLKRVVHLVRCQAPKKSITVESRLRK